MKTYTLYVLSVLAAQGFGAQQITVPAGIPDSGLAGPFLAQHTFVPSVRYQQVFDESGFYASGGQQLLITATRFSWVPGHSGGDFTLSNVEMRFSVTLREPDGLSSTFAENIGANETLVRSGPLQIHSVYDVPYSTVTIPLQTPFYYDRSMGNLLLDVKNFETHDFGYIPPDHFPQFVAMDRLNDQVSYVGVGNVTSQSGSAYTDGLITTFTYEIVPEPSAWVLMLAGLGILVLAATKPWRRISRKRSGVGLNAQEPPNMKPSCQ